MFLQEGDSKGSIVKVIVSDFSQSLRWGFKGFLLGVPLRDLYDA